MISPLPMANFNLTFIILCSCISTLVFLSITTGSAASGRKNDLINRVCKNTTSFAFCEDVIYSDPHAPDADQDFLAYIAFRAAYFNATATANYIATLKHKKSRLVGLRKCLVYYRNAVQRLAEMVGNLESESYYDLDTLSSRVEADARACKALVGARSVISRRNEDMIKLANICLVISKLYSYH